MAKRNSSKSGAGAPGNALVIVESPAKARTIGKYLGSGYTVEASIGHVRDLPQGAAQIPAQYKSEPWSNLGVNVNDNFTPIYIVPPGKSKQIKLLKDRLKEADALYLATDEDREGEAISWHLLEILKPKVPVHRLVFHEITKDAIQAALAVAARRGRWSGASARNPPHSRPACTAMKFRRCLWRKVRPKLSAGRVQSVAVRMIVERERERMAFVSATWWDLIGKFAKTNGQQLEADLMSVDGRRVPSGKDFDPATGKAQEPGDDAARRPRRSRPRRADSPRRVPRRQRRRQAVHFEALPAFHDQHAAARSQSQARLHRPADDAGRPKPVRKRSHHLHAYRFDQPGTGGDRRRPAAGDRRIRQRVSAGRGPRLSSRKSKTLRRPTKAFARPAIRSSCPAHCGTSSTPTNSRSSI